MKKYSILLAITALIIASLACQTIMGGGDDTQQPLPPVDSGDTSQPTEESSSTDGGDITVGGETEFPLTSDAANVVTADGYVTYQTNLSGDDVVNFYQDEFGKLGYTEDSTLSTNFSGIFTLVFNGHESGKQIWVAGAPVGDGTTSVTITLQ